MDRQDDLIDEQLHELREGYTEQQRRALEDLTHSYRVLRLRDELLVQIHPIPEGFDYISKERDQVKIHIENAKALGIGNDPFVIQVANSRVYSH